MSEQIVSTGNERDDRSNEELRAAGFTIPREGTLYEYEWDADTEGWIPVVDAPTDHTGHSKGAP